MTEKVSTSEALMHMARVLKNARAKSGLSLDEVSRYTRIQKYYLEKIEEGDFSFLPGAYIIAYIREYAREMGVSENETLEQCKKDLIISSVPSNSTPGEEDSFFERDRKSFPAIDFRSLRLPDSIPPLKIALVLIVLAALIGLFLFFK